MSKALHELYQNIILDHNKRPRHYGTPDVYTHSAEGFNPLCGDKVSLFLALRDEYIEAICFESASCAVCKASASIMVETLSGKSLQSARQTFHRINELLSADLDQAVDLSIVGELAALAGVRKFPARVKCALLPWETFMNVERKEH